jgi:hypothetical protein
MLLIAWQDLVSLVSAGLYADFSKRVPEATRWSSSGQDNRLMIR